MENKKPDGWVICDKNGNAASIAGLYYVRLSDPKDKPPDNEMFSFRPVRLVFLDEEGK